MRLKFTDMLHALLSYFTHTPQFTLSAMRFDNSSLYIIGVSVQREYDRMYILHDHATGSVVIT